MVNCRPFRCDQTRASRQLCDRVSSERCQLFTNTTVGQNAPCVLPLGPLGLNARQLDLAERITFDCLQRS